MLELASPKISIIIPSYNSGHDLETCLKSILSQTYTHKEIIIIDGKSTDNTIEIIKKYEQQITYWISEPDQGIYDAMNKGMAAATGEWLYFMGSDDTFYNDKVLEEIFTNAEWVQNDVIYGDVILKDSGIRYDGQFDAYKLYYKNICHQAIFTRKEVFNKLGLFDLDYKVWADYEFNIRWFNHHQITKKYINLPIVFYNSNGFSSVQEDKRFLEEKDNLFWPFRDALKISVIIPNYNHATYLPQRIESVLNQTWPFLEVIILDDCSTDNSREIIEQYARQDNRISVIYNKQNSGSTFKQWNKGVKEAKGKYIWIAESDDYAEENFLKNLMEHMVIYPAAGIIYCQSWSIDEYNTTIGNWIEHTKDIDTEKWNNNFIEKGEEVVKNYLIKKNIIPNASAVLFKKSIYEAVGGADEQMKLNGDWLLWIKMLMCSDLAFIANPMNYFRTHTQNVRKNMAQNGKDIEELSKILHHLTKTTNIEESKLNRIIHYYLEGWLQRNLLYNISMKTNFSIYNNLNQIDNYLQKRLLKVLIRNKKSSKALAVKFFKNLF